MAEVHIAHWWVGYLMANPLRKLFQDPVKLLGKYIHDGSRVLEIGPGMGFFTLPAAELAGERGKVYTIDIQEKMLAGLRKRAVKKKLDGRIDIRLCDSHSFCTDGLAGSIDFCLLIYVVHEIPNKHQLFTELANSIKAGGIVYFSEPYGHVSKADFEQSMFMLEAAGFKDTGRQNTKRSLTATLVKI